MVSEFGVKRCELLAEQAIGAEVHDSKFPQKRWPPLRPSTKHCCYRVADGNADGATEFVRDSGFR